MSWTNPKETETIIKNMVGSIIGDLELFDLAAYENISSEGFSTAMAIALG